MIGLGAPQFVHNLTMQCKASATASSSSSARPSSPRRREPPYFLADDGYVYQQERVDGPTEYLGVLANFVSLLASGRSSLSIADRLSLSPTIVFIFIRAETCSCKACI